LLMMIPISASGKSAVGARRDVLFVQRGGSPGEFLGIAPAMGACVGEMWALKAFEVAIAETEAVTESCCHDDQTQ
jgi:hypothetical protein